MAWKTLDAQSRAADAQSRAADAQSITSYLGFGTLFLASLGLVKVDNDIMKLRKEQAARDFAYKAEQAERDLAYKAEQASRDLAAAATLNVTVLLLARQTPPTPPPMPPSEKARLTASLLLPAMPLADAPAVTMHFPDGLRAVTARVSPDSSAGFLYTRARLLLTAAGADAGCPFDLHAMWAVGLDAVMVQDEPSLALRAAGMVGDADVTLVWRGREGSTPPT